MANLHVTIPLPPGVLIERFTDGWDGFYISMVGDWPTGVPADIMFDDLTATGISARDAKQIVDYCLLTGLAS